MRALAGLAVALVLAGCSDPAPTAADEPVSVADVEARFPDVDVQGVAGCVRANASADELTIMASGGDAAAEMTRLILQRAATQQCIVDNNVSVPEPNA